MSGSHDRYVLTLFISGATPRSTRAISNIRSICERLLSGNYELTVVDLYQQPALASGQNIIASPTLIRKLPLPFRRLVGDLSDTSSVVAKLNLGTAGGDTPTP